jgi:hypothetical protein
MPVRQERIIALINAGQYHADIIDEARSLIYALFPGALAAIKRLEETQLTEDQTKNTTILWETIEAITGIKDITMTEWEMRRILITEMAHFKAFGKRNIIQRNYQERRRAIRVETNMTDEAPLGKPIKTTPRNNTEQEKLIHELHRRLWLIEEKNSWRGSELVDVISATIPKQSPTVILNEMLAAKKICYNKSTDRYEIENPQSDEIAETKGDSETE